MNISKKRKVENEGEIEWEQIFEFEKKHEEDEEKSLIFPLRESLTNQSIALAGGNGKVKISFFYSSFFEENLHNFQFLAE